MNETPTLYERLNRLVDKGETRFGNQGWVFLVVFLLMLAASFYVRPGTNYYGHGVHFEALSRNPLDLRNGNVLGFRIMTPLLAFLVGLRGKSFILLNLVFAGVTIGAVYRYFRSRSNQPGDALFGAMCLTFSSVVLVTIYYAGFCDALTYLALFLMWRWRSRPLLFYPLLLAGVLNHESVLFTIPWFAYLKVSDASRKSAALAELLIGLGAVLLAYYLFRRWISLDGEIGLTSGSYLRSFIADPLFAVKPAYLFYWVGLFSVFKLLWVFPLVAVVAMWKNGRRRDVYGIVILMACAVSQLAIAYDTTRMLTLGFLVLIIPLEYLFTTGTYRFRQWAPWVLIGNLLVPQLYTAANIVEIMHSIPATLLRMIIEKGPYWVG
ncbi:MAG: hypothetical protein PHR28_11020 [candidate division Zixibacteria bacterium]|nr:hypothetical protein [candidate division Zixibacteria bacterium]